MTELAPDDMRSLIDQLHSEFEYTSTSVSVTSRDERQYIRVTMDKIYFDISYTTAGNGFIVSMHLRDSMKIVFVYRLNTVQVVPLLNRFVSTGKDELIPLVGYLYYTRYRGCDMTLYQWSRGKLHVDYVQPMFERKLIDYGARGSNVVDLIVKAERDIDRGLRTITVLVAISIVTIAAMVIWHIY